MHAIRSLLTAILESAPKIPAARLLASLKLAGFWFDEMSVLRKEYDEISKGALVRAIRKRATLAKELEEALHDRIRRLSGTQPWANDPIALHPLDPTIILFEDGTTVEAGACGLCLRGEEVYREEDYQYPNERRVWLAWRLSSAFVESIRTGEDWRFWRVAGIVDDYIIRYAPAPLPRDPRPSPWSLSLVEFISRYSLS